MIEAKLIFLNSYLIQIIEDETDNMETSLQNGQISDYHTEKARKELAQDILKKLKE